MFDSLFKINYDKTVILEFVNIQILKLTNFHVFGNLHNICSAIIVLPTVYVYCNENKVNLSKLPIFAKQHAHYFNIISN